jgi:hypothetical protein
MIAALAYLQFYSVKNRLITRIKRLRQPKYLFGAIVGGIYFYWYAFANVARMRRQGLPGTGTMGEMSNDVLAIIELLGAVVLAIVVVFGWLLPNRRAALAFTEAEIAFLFPAPVSRRMLINFKLLKSQLAVLFSSLIMALIASRSMHGGGRFLFHVLGWWVVFATLNLHFLGSSFVRTLLFDRGVSNWQRRLGILALLVVAVGAVFLWARQTLTLPAAPHVSSPEQIPRQILNYIRPLLENGPAFYLLMPFRIVLGPYLAKTWGEFFVALGPAFLLMALHYWWIVRCDVAFEEASLDYSRKIADRMNAMRANNWQQISKPTKAKKAPFTLQPAGNPFVGLLWKNLIGAGQTLGLRAWLMAAWMTIFSCFFVSMQFKSSGAGLIIGGMAAMTLAFSLLIGPQMLRCDFRHDLLSADVLKMYPMRGWQIVLGELLAPVVLLTAVQWLLVLIATISVADLGSRYHLSLALRGSMALGALVLCPMINLVLLMIPNAAVLVFPAWFHAKEPPQGIEVMGQRLILFLGQFIFLMLALVLPGLVFAGVLALLMWALNLAVAFPVAALLAGAVLAAEAWFAIRELGKVFEKLDLSVELGA